MAHTHNRWMMRREKEGEEEEEDLARDLGSEGEAASDSEERRTERRIIDWRYVIDQLVPPIKQASKQASKQKDTNFKKDFRAK